MENAIILKDNDSEIVKILPSHLLGPAITISKILRFENVEEYPIELIRRDILSYWLGGDNIEEHFQECLGQFIEREESKK